MEILPYIFIAIVGFVSGIVSGISGGGGAMIMIPAFIFTGLPPQVAVATAKLSGLGGDFGGLSGFLKSGHIRKDIIKVMLPIAVIVGLITPLVFAAVESRGFQIALAIFMILMLPTLFIKKKTLKRPTHKHKFIGYILYTCVLFLQGIFSGGVGSLAVYVLTLLFGTSKLETMATRRAIVAVMSPIALIALFIGGFINVGYGLAGLIPAFIGTYIGTKIVLKRGEIFVTIVMAVTILISSMVLLITA
ncbi:MAG: sulfite exporter TauE/SafE family protein [Candidatus Saccharimonadales bacterium]